MARSDMYRKLPWTGGDARSVAEIVNNLVEGKSNNTGDITLVAGGASSTTIYDERIGYNSYIGLEPKTQTAASTYFPYGAFQDTTDQSIATTTATANITLNATDYSLGTSLVDGYKVKVDYSGLYNVQFSIQFVNTDNAQHDLDIWFRKNGSDVAGSNSKFTVPARKSASIYGHLIAALNFNVELAKDDYVSLAWATSSTLVTVEHLAAQTTPTRPATPSVIVTIQYLSANSFTTNLFTEPYISSQINGQATISHPANTGTNKVYRYIIVG
jgi:hypothetical protein